MSRALLLLLALGACYAEVYLHFPRGSNNRMDDGGRDRDNGARLFDSQNNNRGGNNRGAGQDYFYEGSELSFSWTFDKGCGGPEGQCTVIIQYACDRNMRDGYWTWSTWSNTIPFFPDDQNKICEPYAEKWVSYPNGAGQRGNCTQDFRYGRHESVEYYQDCWRRSRNRGLWTADQNMNGYNSAVSTRQKPNQWSRYGYECPEERDYYPYWGPSPWRDVAILTDTPGRCDAYRAASFNNAEATRWICVMRNDWHAQQPWWNAGYVPVTQLECEDPTKRPAPNNRLIYNNDGELLNAGVWTAVAGHGIDPPICIQSPRMRNNELGNSEDTPGFPAYWNWTIPALDYADPLAHERCVLRMRYNVSNVELPTYGWASDTSIDGSLDWQNNSDTVKYLNQDVMLPTNFSLWTQYGLTYNEVKSAFTPSQTKDVGRGYVYESWPTVDIYGIIAEGGLLPKGGGGNTTAVGRVYLQLGIDTSDTPRTFEDRTHTFAIRKLPEALKGYKIHNLGVQGKRGNIVQTFPGTEYDFYPYNLEVKKGDLIHIQWNGANTNPQGNAGEGPAGFDRSNILVQRPINYYEFGQGTDTRFTTIGHWGNNYPARIDSDQGRFLNLSYEDCWRLAVPALNSGYNDLGLRQITANANTTYHYISTRNNNFSNRGQKAKLTILPADGPEPALVAPETFEQINGVMDIGFVKLSPPHNSRLYGMYQISLEDAGPSGYATHYAKVSPRIMSVPDGGFIGLSFKHKWVPFTYGNIFWYEQLGDEGYELFTMAAQWEWDGTGHATAKINMGGYYVVKYVVNGSAVGGLIIGVLGIAVMVYFAYRRFGCRIFNKTQVDQQKEGLLPSGAPSSSSSAAPAATTTTV